MVKYIALAALILAAGCASNNNVSTKQATPQPTKITTHSHSQSRSTDPASIKKNPSIVDVNGPDRETVCKRNAGRDHFRTAGLDSSSGRHPG